MPSSTWDLIHAERRRLISDLEPLTAEQWRTESLCAGLGCAPGPCASGGPDEADPAEVRRQVRRVRLPVRHDGGEGYRPGGFGHPGSDPGRTWPRMSATPPPRRARSTRGSVKSWCTEPTFAGHWGSPTAPGRDHPSGRGLLQEFQPADRVEESHRRCAAGRDRYRLVARQRAGGARADPFAGPGHDGSRHRRVGP